MRSSVAVTAGTLALVTVLLLGLIGRRPAGRVPSPADDARPPHRSTRRPTAGILAVALLTGVAFAALGPLPVSLAGAAAVVLHRRRSQGLAAARRRAIDAAMPDAVELLVLCIHAGCSPTQALVAVAARAPPVIRSVFADVELGLHRGRTLAESLGTLATTAGALGPEVVAAMRAADRDGLPLAPVLDRLTADARAARRRLGEAEARRLPVRLTFPLVLCTLPAFVLLAIAPAVLGALSTLRATVP